MLLASSTKNEGHWLIEDGIPPLSFPLALKPKMKLPLHAFFRRHLKGEKCVSTHLKKENKNKIGAQFCKIQI